MHGLCSKAKKKKTLAQWETVTYKTSRNFRTALIAREIQQHGSPRKRNLMAKFSHKLMSAKAFTDSPAISRRTRPKVAAIAPARPELEGVIVEGYNSTCKCVYELKSLKTVRIQYNFEQKKEYPIKPIAPQ